MLKTKPDDKKKITKNFYELVVIAPVSLDKIIVLCNFLYSYLIQNKI
jgi:hypothetical protein